MFYDDGRMVEYISDRFMENNVVAKKHDIESVFDYEQEYYLNHADETEKPVAVEVTLHVEKVDDIVDYIQIHRPDLIRNDIHEILELEDDYYMQKYNSGFSDGKK